MYHRLAISGSTILSEESRFEQLFQHKLEHVEIGEFLNEDAFQHYLDLIQKHIE
ncbi:hypothetical protein [Bacillus suaedaesalsae]|uniref:Uncharacterized protein n=1 Tax=Bacillus suaedaesalsae TaxID=2810349 RepID=A0ABS2DG19_9BACI|nr:hypothetical protein [Bacillus suaedaesalsae]MBM6617423.1 hypothetical protein [Bacillus suaedaesalsae]